MSTDVRERLRRVLADRLESLALAGIRELPKSRSVDIPPRSSGLQPAIQESAQESAQYDALPRIPLNSAKIPAPPAVMPSTMKNNITGPQLEGNVELMAEAGEPVGVSHAPSLEVLSREVASCTRCEELARTRTQTVFGVGNPNARLCFLGEAPGADEDRHGEPFVGRAGQLLNKIIEACRMKREDVYICNILKCRPPGNRNPLPAEAANCRGFLDRQLELLAPEFICCLGAVAAQNLLATQQTIGKLRGSVHSYRSAKVVCTYHPAYLLRNPSAKKDAWEDMQLLMREMGIEL
jgi:DNA polymerase